MVIAARELNPSGLPGNTWENRHLAYTHGYGAAFAPGSQMTPNGQPAFIDTTVDSNTAPYLSQPAIYFGENLSDYAVVAHEALRDLLQRTGPGRAGHLPGQRRREHGLHRPPAGVRAALR